jgi:phosphotriesterase-related protein
MAEQSTVQTVTGPIPLAALGRTLMHEHLQVAMPGWEIDDLEPGPTFRDLVERCVDKVEELKSAGFSSMVDPCPSDLGRDVELMREVSRRTNFNIVCATGFYHHELGANQYWRMRMLHDPDTRKRVTDFLIRDITRGFGKTDIKPGILKTATAAHVTPYEDMMMTATAHASVATGIPITTHTDGIHGDVQVDTMCRAGAKSERIIVGHSCGSNDTHYHQSIVDRGAYIGFDRFGMDYFNSDDKRVANLVKLVRAGYGDRIVVSHDCVICSRGMEKIRAMRPHGMMLFSRVIVPMLREAGLNESEIDRLTIDNPRRYFSGVIPDSVKRGATTGPEKALAAT